MQTQLPLELVDHILSFLHDDHPSLRCCAEVNPILSQLVERHLFCEITLTNLEGFNGIDELTPAQLTKIFTDTPRLKSHVRSLRIVIAAMGILRWFMKRSMNDEDIGKILPLFPQVSSVFLSGRHHSKMSWHRFHNIFQKSFLELLRLPVMENLSLDGIEDFPLPLLDHSTSLQRLSLLRLNYPMATVQDFPAEPLHHTDRAQLKSLDIGDCSTALPTILTWIQSPHSPQIRHLTSLRISIHQPEDIPQLQVLLAECASHLKELYICANEIARTTYDITNEIIFPPETAPHQVLDLSGLSSLTSLSVSGTIKSMDTFWISSDGQEEIQDYVLDTCIPWFSQLFLTLLSSETSSRLERIVLKVTFLVDQHSLTKLDWKPLTTTLQSASLSSLRHVELRAIYCDSTSLDLPTLISSLHADKNLSRLVESGLLLITGYKAPISHRRSVKL